MESSEGVNSNVLCKHLNQLVIVHIFVFLWVFFLIKVISCKPWLVLIKLYGQESACVMYYDNKHDLIWYMDEANTVKEKVKVLGDDLKAERQLILEKDKQLQATKEKIKTVTAKAVDPFQQNDEYNTLLFSWYYKGFELLHQYLVKHPSGVDLEEVHQDMAGDEASQSTTAPPVGDAPGDAPVPPSVGDDEAAI